MKYARRIHILLQNITFQLHGVAFNALQPSQQTKMTHIKTGSLKTLTISFTECCYSRGPARQS